MHKVAEIWFQNKGSSLKHIYISIYISIRICGSSVFVVMYFEWELMFSICADTSLCHSISELNQITGPSSQNVHHTLFGFLVFIFKLEGDKWSEGLKSCSEHPLIPCDSVFLRPAGRPIYCLYLCCSWLVFALLKSPRIMRRASGRCCSILVIWLAKRCSVSLTQAWCGM